MTIDIRMSGMRDEPNYAYFKGFCTGKLDDVPLCAHCKCRICEDRMIVAHLSDGVRWKRVTLHRGCEQKLIPHLIAEQLVLEEIPGDKGDP